MLGHPDHIQYESAEFGRIVWQNARGLNFRVKGWLSSPTGWRVILRWGYGGATTRCKMHSWVLAVDEFQDRSPAYSLALLFDRQQGVLEPTRRSLAGAAAVAG